MEDRFPVTEEEFVSRLIEWTGGESESRIGDDAAVLDAFSPPLLLTTDTMNFEVHYDGRFSPTQIGGKLAGVNLSDIAAMGGTPKWALLSLSSRRDPDEQHRICRGLLDQLRPREVQLVGGDLSTTANQGEESVALTLVGRAHPEGILLRSRARAGDQIYVTGPLGGSAAVLENHSQKRSGEDQDLLHEVPDRLPTGRRLVEVGVRCGMDVTDGLLKDLRRICSASGAGARLDWRSIPIHPRASELAESREQAIGWALGGGEDFELLAAVPPEHRSAREDLGGSFIGEFTDGEELRFEPALPRALAGMKNGWDHFQPQS